MNTRPIKQSRAFRYLLRGTVIPIALLCSLPAFAQTAGEDSLSLQIQQNRLGGSGENAGKKPHLYRMNYWVSGGFNVLATAGNFYAIPNILHAKKNLTDAEIAALNRDAISGFDRLALRQNPAKRDQFYKIGDVVLPAVLLSPVLLAIDDPIRKDWARLLLMYYEVQSAAFTLYNFSPFGPGLQNRLRPVVYYPEIDMGTRKGGNQRNSFFSGHTAQTAATTFFMVKVYSDYHPEIGGKKYLLYGLATIPPLVEGYFRIKALAHFPSDVLAGAILGSVCGVAIPALHRFKDRKIHFAMATASGQPGVGLVWKPTKKTFASLPTFAAASPKP